MDRYSQDFALTSGLTPSPEQLHGFQCYLDLLVEWNQKVNLTAIREPEEIVRKHFLDSLSILPLLADKPAFRLIDVGTGAGFPGIPLKIMLPDLKLTLVDATGKKTKFCQLVVDELHLTQVDVVTARAEEIGRQPSHRESYDVVTARAVANLPILLEYLLPLAKVGGLVIAQKGDSAPDEVVKSRRAIHTLGGELLDNRKVKVFGLEDERYLVIIRKLSHTPAEYPRHGGTITKRPL